MQKEYSFIELRKNIFHSEKINNILGLNLSKHTNLTSGEEESILKHQTLCLDYFIRIAKERNLDQIYDNILKSMDLDVNLIKIKILEAVFYHDIGKINPNFQNKSNDDISVDTHHSESSYYFLLYLNKKILKNINDESLNSFVIASLIRTITYHHTHLENFDFSFIEEDTKIASKNPILTQIFKILNINENIDLIKVNKYKLIKKLHKRDLFYLIKLFYSQLVLSDYYSTFDFTYGQNIEIKNIQKELLLQLENSFENSQQYNNCIDRQELKELEECHSLNELRANLLIQAHKTNDLLPNLKVRVSYAIV